MKNIFKYASLLLAAVMLAACSGTVDPETDGTGTPNPDQNPDQGQTPSTPKELVVSSDKNLIQTFGGDYATITVKLGDEVLTDGVLFFDGEDQPIDIPDFKFSTEKAGEHVIWANYGTYISKKITISAINTEIPVTPEDPQPASTSFKTRVLVTEFTTTGCTYCPGMKALLHDALAKDGVADKLVITACHSSTIGNVKDPAYIKTGYEDFSNMTGMPYVFCDMFSGFPYYKTWSSSDVIAVFDEMYAMKDGKAAGIAVTSSIKDGQLVVKATVKAAQTGEYRIGAFLLEDGIYGKQTNASADWMHNHDNVIRYIDSSTHTAAGREQFYGYPVGNVEAGKTADYVFVWDLEKIWEDGSLAGEINGGTAWDPFVTENLHLAVFTSTIGVSEAGDEYYYVNNAVDCPIGEDVTYDYK